MGPGQLVNNSLVTPDTEALICATNSRSCCTADSSDNWYLPDGTMIGPQVTNGTPNVSVSRENQTLALIFSNQLELATGIYYCVITDDSNITNILYVGIYPPLQG